MNSDGAPPPPAPTADLLADYEALRRGIGAYWLGRDALSITGPDALSYLQGQCSQDLGALRAGAAADALLLEPDGKLTVLVRVARLAEDAFVLDAEAGYGEVAAARLARFKLRSKVAIEPLAWTCVAVRGPGANEAVPQGGSTLRLPFAWNGVTGVDLLGSDVAGAVPDAARWCGRAAWEALRVEAGIPAMGLELDGRTIAAEAHLVERTVSFTKGCYTGQELVARLDARGNRVPRRLCGLVVEGEGRAAPAEALVGAEVFAGDGAKSVGRVTSAAWCPGLGGPAALAFLHRSVELPATLRLSATAGTTGGAPAPVEVQGRALPLVD